MTEAQNNAHDEQDRRDILVARIVDGAATAEDWRELRGIAARDQSIWAEIAETQELCREIGVAMEEAGATADRVELPARERTPSAPGQRLRLAMSAGGWLAAACVLLAWSVGTGSAGPVDGSARPRPATPTAGIATPITTAADALKRYLELGRESGEVLGELPTSVVLDRTPLADGGGYEVVYLRQIVEKTTVQDIYETVTGDTGELFVVPKTPEPASPTIAW
ncbi:MAG: hypothetical protein ACTS22_08255 [Phycisphaerales bacterium]